MVYAKPGFLVHYVDIEEFTMTRKNLFVGDAVLVPTLEIDEKGNQYFSGSYNMVPISAVIDYQIEEYLKAKEFPKGKTKLFEKPKNIASMELSDFLQWVKDQEDHKSQVLNGEK